MITTFHCATVNVACDTLLCGLLMHMYCQLEILEYRLNKISSNQITVGYCVRHHNLIYEFAQLVNTRFNQIIGFQFIASTMVICSNLYQLTNPSSNTNPVLLIMYTSCMLTQIFIYCWFGNKIKVKSLQLSDSIFQMNWPAMNNNVTKSLLIIMNRAEIPIEISTAYILSMNLDSFVALLKTSYSAYNLLVRMQEGFLNIACDCFFSGLLLHISCQIEILEHRLSKVANNQVKLRECVIHHYRIFEFASVLNDKLVIVIGSQFIGSCLVVCCLFFRLTVSTSNSVYIETMLCIACALLEIFYYCWFGNEVRVKSLELSENIYKMKWLELSNSMRKCFLIIMHRATLPIKFTSARIIPLNLESFVVVLKMSYSAFNLMRQTQGG
ncbi:odorant receptor 46a-like [Odontomachus brunneus]|uniref:odorant receptor 46a-like n=1 Tax=Odontomachus brunneus TaxID=486640 RepID=UPI0013F18707|nr:odorant receptor 46a-like [Odontomachus brunneus]